MNAKSYALAMGSRSLRVGACVVEVAAMSDLTTYRICSNCNGEGFVHDWEGVLLGTCMECHAYGGMILDTRLRNIADAWREYKAEPLYGPRVMERQVAVFDLLDALVGEDARGI